MARVGGDEFAVVLPRADEAGASLAAGKIVHALRRPFAVEGSTLEVAGSLGIALFPRDGEDADTLLRRADIALYVAKRSGSSHSVYRASDDRSEQVSAVAELRTALDRDELVIHVQPQVRLSSRAVVGMEALVRWRHPVRGVLLPEAFLAAAEPTGIMNRLTERVLAKALEQARRWEEAGHELVLAVNVSARNLLEVALPDAVASALQDARVRPERLCLEITETLLMTYPERAAERLAKLRGLGVRISIDDFGTGYSSLAHLQRLPVEQLKVDKSFVRQLRSDRSAAAIVRAAVDLGHNLGLEIVAEGVEDRETCEELAAMGCDLAQGYYISPPLPADEIEAWLRDHR